MKNEKEMWAQIINDARFYDGTPQMLTQITEHFKTHYTVAQKLKQPDVIESVCRCKEGKQGRTVDENFHQICDVCGGY